MPEKAKAGPAMHFLSAVDARLSITHRRATRTTNLLESLSVEASRSVAVSRSSPARSARGRS
jgi:hypothetical protein